MTQSSIAETAAMPGQYLGPATCASSNCHGSASPRAGSNILQNEYVTWQRHDQHAKAFAVLSGSDAKKIAEHLGISDASTEPQCLNCHATYVPEKDLRSEKFSISDGVSCESCHGAAGAWIQSHAMRGATHASNIENGMLDVVRLQNRTQTCMKCHVGNDKQFVGHRLIGAGHPRLTFDLDTFEALQPRHWSVDEDYIHRKQAYHPATAWLQGQLELAQDNVDRFLSSERSHAGLMPELSNYHCYSCHHSLKEMEWKSRSYAGRPGELRPNFSQLELFGEALKVMDEKAGVEWGSLLRALDERFGREKTDDLFEGMNGILKSKRSAFESVQLSQSQVDALVKNLASRLTVEEGTYYQDAEQTALAISSLSAQSEESTKRYKRQLDELYKFLRDPERFNSKGAAQAVKRMARP